MVFDFNKSISNNIHNQFNEFWGRLCFGQWEQETFNALDVFLDKDKDFIDIGAWIFPISLYSSKLCNKVFAIEPIKSNYDEGLRNIRLNKITNIIAINKALWSKTDTLKIKEKIDKDTSTYSITDIGNDIEAIGFNDFKQQYDISNVSVVKMDIEGGEGILLNAMADWLHQNKVTLILSTHEQFKLNKKDYFKMLNKVIDNYPYGYIIDKQEYLFTYDNTKKVNKIWQKIKK